MKPGIVVFFILLACLGQHVARAQGNHFRLYDPADGLDASEVLALAQDPTGFIWLGTMRGVWRYDGRHFEQWGGEVLDEGVMEVVASPNGELLAQTRYGRAFRRSGNSFEPLTRPDGDGNDGFSALCFDAHGELAVVVDGALWRRDATGIWRSIELGDHIGTLRHLVATPRGLIAIDAVSAWLLVDDAEPQLLLRAPDLRYAVADSERIWIGSDGQGELWRIDAEGVHHHARMGGRMLGLALRKGTLWISVDRYLKVVGSDDRTRTLTLAGDLPSGGPLLIDHEGSLWQGTFVGLAQFPEPDTWHWGERDGLPSRHAFGIAADGDSLWVRTWGGAARLPLPEASRFQVELPGWVGMLCAGSGGTWIIRDQALQRWDGRRFTSVPITGASSPSHLNACVEDASGNLWLATIGTGLIRIPPGDGHPRAIDVDLPDPLNLLWLDSDAHLSGATDELACRLDSTDEGHVQSHDCHKLDPHYSWNAAAGISGGRTWLGSSDGLFELDHASLRNLPGNRLRPGGRPIEVRRTKAGYWIAGGGTVERVVPCDGCEYGWRTLERVGEWQGLPGNSALAALEQVDGAIWVVGNRGVWRVPRHARGEPRLPPRVVPIRVHVAGHERRLDGPVKVEPGRRDISIEFAGLSFRDRSLLRFRSRIGESGDWSTPSREPILQLAGLRPGPYRVEMSASLDQAHWSEPAVLEFRVLPAWHETWWARLIAILGVLGVTAWIVWIRMTARLRLEQERTRIAMDLHDELGSGLGSIGLLAGVAIRDDIPAPARSQIVHEIADQAVLLGSGLRSLVWSLRHGEADVAELGDQIAACARRFFPGDHPGLRMELEIEARTATLGADVRRHLLLLALEALNNVARHASATTVQVEFRADRHGALSLTISDDGCGFDPARERAGVGLESMRRRATVIGAHLEVHSQPGDGCKVELHWPVAGAA